MATNVTAPTLRYATDSLYIYEDTSAHNTQNQAELFNWTVPSEGRSGRWRLAFVSVATTSAATSPDPTRPFSVRLDLSKQGGPGIVIGTIPCYDHYEDGDAAADGWIAFSDRFVPVPLDAGDIVFIYAPISDTNGAPTADYQLTLGLQPWR